VTGLPESSPRFLVAIFNYECAEYYPDLTKDERTEFALNLGYPSLLFDLRSSVEVVDLVKATAYEGDRGFFLFDPKILNALEERASFHDLDKTIDFVSAALKPEKEFLQGAVSYDFLIALPLWKNPDNMKRLLDWCSANSCNITPTQCSGDVGLADKLALAKGDISFEEVYTQCPANFRWIRALRRAGLVDTTCTSAYQINNILNLPAADTVLEKPDILAKACYPNNFLETRNVSKDSYEIIRALRSQWFEKKVVTNVTPSDFENIWKALSENRVFRKLLSNDGIE
jgi:hypothetical protein